MSDMAGSQMSARPGKGTARTGRELADAGVISPDKVAEIDRVAQRYAVAVTPDMLALIDTADPEDPIARQFVPDAAELRTAAEEMSDPIGDEHLSPVKGVVHGYPYRGLLEPWHN